MGDDHLRRGLWPLPGPANRWGTTLEELVALAADEPTTDEFLDRLGKECPSVGTTAFRYLAVLKVTGFVRQEGGHVIQGDYGRRLLRRSSSSETVIASALVNRVAGVREIMVLLSRGPLRSGLIHQELSKEFGWKSPNQVQFRLKWMETADMVERRKARYPLYELTARGKRILTSSSQGRIAT